MSKNKQEVPQRMEPGSRLRPVTLAGLSVALLAVSGAISVPLGTVPVTLQVFAVVLIALLLDPLSAAAAFGGYLLFGAMGAPVFSGFRGGVGVLAGPTGGYLVGFAVAAILGSWIRALLVKRLNETVADVIAAVLMLAVIYAVGTPWLAVVAGMSASKALAVGVLPFLVFDAAKVLVAVGIASAVRRALPGRFSD